MKKKLLYSLAIILVIMVFTNPSLTDFKDSGHSRGAKKENNYLIFSTFIQTTQPTYKTSDGTAYVLPNHYIETHYLGILKNFIEFGTKETK
jgi:hypothetical protein